VTWWIIWMGDWWIVLLYDFTWWWLFW